MPDRRLTGGGLWNPGSEPLYFLAGGPRDPNVKYVSSCRYHLKGVEHLTQSRAKAEGILEDIQLGAVMLLDSGAFALAQAHARAHDISLAAALAAPVDEVDGFQAHWQAYLEWCRHLDPLLWGYIELDLGGTATKKRNRASCEAAGLRPIPVYHPLIDPPDYFDELCATYDRVAVGNLAMMKRGDRVRMLATLWERKKKHPGVWVHLLGVSPDGLVLSYPFESLDSSSWLGGVRWDAATRTFAMCCSFGMLDPRLGYERGSDPHGPTGSDNGAKVAAKEGEWHGRAWRQVLRDREVVLGAS